MRYVQTIAFAHADGTAHELPPPFTPLQESLYTIQPGGKHVRMVSGECVVCGVRVMFTPDERDQVAEPKKVELRRDRKGVESSGALL